MIVLFLLGLVLAACDSSEPNPANPPRTSAGAAGSGVGGTNAGASGALQAGEGGEGDGGDASGSGGGAGGRTSPGGATGSAGEDGEGGEGETPGVAGAGGDTSSPGGSGSAGTAGEGGSADGEGGSGGGPLACPRGERCVYLEEGFEDNCPPSGWIVRGDWQCGTPGEGKPAPRTGAGVVATQLFSNYSPLQPYDFSVVRSVPIDLSFSHQPVLEFYAWVYTEPEYDGFNVKVTIDRSQLSAIATDPPYPGEAGFEPGFSGDFAALGYRRYLADLSEFVGKTIRVGFAFTSDYTIELPGVSIDDVSVFEAALLPADFASPAVPRCTPGAERCLSRVAQLCTETGTWQTRETCAFACTGAGVCGGDCRTGQSRCGSPSVRQECDASGAFVDAETCLAGCSEDRCSGRVFAESFEGECPPAGWALSAEWQCGTPTRTGPDAARSGSHVIATQIASTYHNGQIFESAFAESPVIDLAGMSEPHLEFWAYVDTEEGDDGFNVMMSVAHAQDFRLVSRVSPLQDQDFIPLPAWSGDHSAEGYRRFIANLSALAGQAVSLRFAFTSSARDVASGVYIDDVTVQEAADTQLVILTTSVPDAFGGLAYVAPLSREGGSSAATWSIVGGTNVEWLSVDPVTGVLSGTPDPVLDVGETSVTVRLAEPAQPANRTEVTYVFRVKYVLFADDFEAACASGWELTGDWECGVPTQGAQAYFWPDSAYDGERCIATQIDAPYSPELPRAQNGARTPPLDLTGMPTARLRFQLWLSTETNYDGLTLQVSTNGIDFETLRDVFPAYRSELAGEPAWHGLDSAFWAPYEADLSDYVGQVVYVRFAFESDQSVVMVGAYVDAVLISE